MLTDELMIKRCLQLALKGRGTTYPNPLVGCVILNNNKIIGEGYHFKAGLPHAEINAINSVKDKSLLKDATLYVNLEPCSHFGKTPPCSNAIINNQIKKVVIGCLDFSSKVNGKGIQLLKENGIEVVVNCLEKESNELNKIFFTFQTKKRPFIILKWATTVDGFIGKENEQVWISNKYSKQVSHKLRANNQSILVGKNTVLIDNPKLTTRQYFGENPIRVIIDRKLEIDDKKEVYTTDSKTIIFNEIKNLTEQNINYIKIDFNHKNYLNKILNELYFLEIQSIIVEGGEFTINSFIEQNLWDEAYVFQSKKVIFNEGVKSPQLKDKKILSEKNVDDDILFTYQNTD